MNITLFEEVIYKFLDPTSSQFVVIALVRAGMVYRNKFLWESLIFKKLWSISQEANWNKQKQTSEKRKLEQMQKPTSVQLDEKVEELMNEKMDSTIPNEVRNILVGHIKPSSFKSRKSYEKYSRKANDNTDTEHAGGFSFHNRRWKNKNKNGSHTPGVANISSGITAGAEISEKKNSEHAQITITILMTQQATANANPPQNAPPPFRSGNQGRCRGRFFWQWWTSRF